MNNLDITVDSLNITEEQKKVIKETFEALKDNGYEFIFDSKEIETEYKKKGYSTCIMNQYEVLMSFEKPQLEGNKKFLFLIRRKGEEKYDLFGLGIHKGVLKIMTPGRRYLESYNLKMSWNAFLKMIVTIKENGIVVYFDYIEDRQDILTENREVFEEFGFNFSLHPVYDLEFNGRTNFEGKTIDVKTLDEYYSILSSNTRQRIRREIKKSNTTIEIIENIKEEELHSLMDGNYDMMEKAGKLSIFGKGSKRKNATRDAVIELNSSGVKTKIIRSKKESGEVFSEILYVISGKEAWYLTVSNDYEKEPNAVRLSWPFFVEDCLNNGVEKICAMGYNAGKYKTQLGCIEKLTFNLKS